MGSEMCIRDRLKTARVVFCGIRAHNQNHISILDVLPMVGHGPAAKRGGQTGHRWTVSYASLVVDVHQTHRPHRLCDQVGVLIRNCRATDPRYTIASIDYTTSSITFGKR